ncbi:MAG: AIR carboxylase family protein [Candidatus Bathyarchaeota archaeon]|nr:AIR carboxylase family protein [Candidatus Bathyarchaeota archaeon]MDH5779374.1 AIR carboxylase family protein [Candidatus Bathyarchaeota archaeon]
MPEQKVVILMGSRSDVDFATSIADLLKHFDVKHEFRIASAHKTPKELVRILEEYETSEEKILYITVAGLSDALSGTVAGFTKYPVIACPPDSKEYRWNKVFSSMMTPRGVSVLFVAEPENAALAAVKILAVSDSSLQNKVARYQQKKREEVIAADKEVRRKKIAKRDME